MKILSEKSIKAMQNFFKAHTDIISCYIFGSLIKGGTHPKSDLDIGIVFRSQKGISPIEIEDHLAKIAGDFDIDVTLMDLSSDPLLLIQVINGKTIYQKSLKDRIELETRILHAYEDYRYFRRIHNYYLKKSFKEGIYAH